LQHWASCFTSIATSFKWDVKPTFLVPGAYAGARKRPNQMQTVACSGLILLAETRSHKASKHSWRLTVVARKKRSSPPWRRNTPRRMNPLRARANAEEEEEGTRKVQ